MRGLAVLLAGVDCKAPAGVDAGATADADAMHVRIADESVCIGPPPSRDSYLNVPAIIASTVVTSPTGLPPLGMSCQTIIPNRSQAAYQRAGSTLTCLRM